MEENNTQQELSATTKEPKSKLLSIIGVISFLGILFCGYIIFSDSNNEKLTPTNNITFEQLVCSQIRVIPTWINPVGIIDEGYSNFENTNPKDSVDLLINAYVTFVYDSDNNVCKNQIGYFGSEWGRYVNSGFTINCKDVS